MNTCSYIKNNGKKAQEQDVSLDTLFELSEFFKFFGDTMRIRIIHLMLSGELSVNEIAEKLNLEQSVVRLTPKLSTLTTAIPIITAVVDTSMASTITKTSAIAMSMRTTTTKRNAMNAFS